jgi:hypothetical protein
MARYLVAMLDFDGGASRGRKAEPGGADTWSVLIDELLAKMKLRDFADQQLLGPRRGPRVVCAFALAGSGDTQLDFVCAGTAPPGGGGEEAGAPEGASPGTSIILIETGNREPMSRVLEEREDARQRDGKNRGF